MDLITMFYITYIVSCAGKPDTPVFFRSTNGVTMGQAYAELVYEYRVNNNFIWREGDNQLKCHLYNLKLQSEVLHGFNIN
jgi:hypothetical protein